MYIIYVKKYLDILNEADQPVAAGKQIGGVPPVAIAAPIIIVLFGLQCIHTHNKIWKNAYLDAAIFDYATKSVKLSQTGKDVNMFNIPHSVYNCTPWHNKCFWCKWKMKFCMCHMKHRASQMRSLENITKTGPGPFRNIDPFCLGSGINNSNYKIEWETEDDCNRLLTVSEVEVDEAEKRLKSGYEVEGYDERLMIMDIRDEIKNLYGDNTPPEGHPLVKATYQWDADYNLVNYEWDDGDGNVKSKSVDIVQKQIRKEKKQIRKNLWWENVFNRMEDRVNKLETKFKPWRGGGGDNDDLMAIFKLIHTEYEKNNNFDITELSKTIYDGYPNLGDTFFNWKEGTALDYVTKWIYENKESISNADDIVSLLSDATANPDNINIKDILEKIIPESLPNRIEILKKTSSFYEDQTRKPASEMDEREERKRLAMKPILDFKAELEEVLSSGRKEGGSRRIKLTRRRRKRKAKKSQRKLRKRTRRRRKGKAKKSRAKRRRTRR